MPTYQYACKDCGHQFETVQSFSDASLTECPVCHGALRKLFGSVGVIFKGSGFYRNDSRDAKKSAVAPGTPAGDKTAPAAASSDTKSGSGDAKTAATPAPASSSSSASTSSSSSSSGNSSTSGSSSGKSASKSVATGS